MGNKAWVLEMEWSGKAEFNKARDQKWTVGGRKAGEYRHHQGLSFLKVYEAGHMVPYDQPEASLEFIQHFTGMAGKGGLVREVDDEL
jgi:cathepsin A (carboxypeptidase C)